MHFLQQQWRRVMYALRGLAFSLRYDRSVRIAVYGLGTVTLAIVFLLTDITHTDALLLLVVYALIVITEIQNSALEYALDHLHPETHDNIGRSKDLAAAAVLVAGVVYIVTVAVLTMQQF